MAQHEAEGWLSQTILSVESIMKCHGFVEEPVSRVEPVERRQGARVMQHLITAWKILRRWNWK